MEVFGFCFGLIVAGVIGIVVAKDANSRGMEGTAWGLGVFLLCIVFLPLYLVVRKPPLDRQTALANCGQAVYAAPPALAPDAVQRPRFCSNCGTSLPAAGRFCPGCGAQVS
ncbi:MAG TPA: hypothetical protein VER03_02060 [Bryobacteraceae bacterium]|nr:hypothetical protein [Bryobacteraceae bacterium]